MSDKPKSKRSKKPSEKSEDIPLKPSKSASDIEEEEKNAKLNEVTIKVDQVKGVLQGNLRQAIDRGNQLNDIEVKTDTLMADADKFNQSATGIKRMFCKRHARNIAIISAIVLILLILIIWASASGNN